MFRARVIVPLLCAAACALPASAVEVQRVDEQGASGMCRPSTPAFANVIRSRPLGMGNESDGQIFVSCNWQGDDSQDSTRGATRLYVGLSNQGTATRDITCTLVNGLQTGSQVFATYTPKTISVPAGGAARMEWVPQDVSASGGLIRMPSVSCVLPGRSSINYAGREYREDVGA
jgi:hypothetical protein